jgi:hypothetical protein
VSDARTCRCISMDTYVLTSCFIESATQCHCVCYCSTVLLRITVCVCVLHWLCLQCCITQSGRVLIAMMPTSVINTSIRDLYDVMHVAMSACGMLLASNF